MKVEGLLQPTLQQKKVKSTLAEYGHFMFDQGIMKQKNTTNVFMAILQCGSNKTHLPYLVPTKTEEPKKGLYIRNVV
jgi:hypothetical protein